MTKKEAKELCILKWKYIVENNGSIKGLTKKYPELNKLLFECAYCEKYYGTRDYDYTYCAKCPIRLKKYIIFGKSSCMTRVHPYYDWFINETKENAQKILDLIIESK